MMTMETLGMTYSATLDETPQPPPPPALALEHPPEPSQYRVAQTLADLDPDAWRIIGRQLPAPTVPIGCVRTSRKQTAWSIPEDEIATVESQRSGGRLITALCRDGNEFLILARWARSTRAPHSLYLGPGVRA
jgi:hypothetical protein